MTSSPLRPIAASAYEALIEDTIIRCEDLYDLDGETLFRSRNGQIETFGPEVDQ